MVNLAAEYYIYIKFVHMFFAFLWAFAVPPAYSVYVKRALADYTADQSNKEFELRLWWTWDQLDKLIVVEHIAWPILIITGPLMFLAAGWSFEMTWVWMKLGIIIIIYVPLEIHDIWFTHIYAANAEANKDKDPEAYIQMRRNQLKYFKSISLLVRITIPMILFLAIVKPM